MTARRITVVAAALAAVAAVAVAWRTPPPHRPWRSSHRPIRAYRLRAAQDRFAPESYGGQPILPCWHPSAGATCYESLPSPPPPPPLRQPGAQGRSTKLLRTLLSKVENLQHGLDAVLLKVTQLSAGYRKSATVHAAAAAADLKAITRSNVVAIGRKADGGEAVECDDDDDDDDDDDEYCADDAAAHPSVASIVSRKVVNLRLPHDDARAQRKARPTQPKSTTESLFDVVRQMETDESSTIDVPDEFGIDAAKLPTFKP